MPTNRKDAAKRRIDSLGLSAARIAKELGFNNREAFYNHFRKDEIDIELYNKIMNKLDEIEKGENFQNTGNIEGSGVVIAGSKLDKSKVKEINNYQCAFNIMQIQQEITKVIEKMCGQQKENYEARLTEKDERIKDLKEVIEMLKNQRAK